MVLAREASEDLRFVYAHFLHTPSSVALYASLMRGVAMGFFGPCQGHLEIAGLGEARQACALDLRRHLHGARRRPSARAVQPSRRTSTSIYHGLDLSRFPAPPPARPKRDGSDEPVTLVSVGRLVEKKGYDLLLSRARPAAARTAMAVCPHWRRRPLRGIAGAGGKPRPRGPRRMARRLQPGGSHRGAATVPIFSSCRAASPAMATATACPMC